MEGVQWPVTSSSVAHALWKIKLMRNLVHINFVEMLHKYIKFSITKYE